MVGHAFMGRTHSHAWRNAPAVFDLPRDPRMVVVAGRDAERTEAAASRLGWAESTTDWRSVLDRDDIDVVDICTPGDSHAEIAIAALEAGKHVLCEKPLANSVAEAEAMVEAAEKAHVDGVRSMVAFNYRRVPALALARQMIAQGAVGEIHHVRARYLQDWLLDPEFPLAWRLQKEHAGSGALGDIGAHIIDATQFLLGDRVAGVSALLHTFVTERPLPSGSDDGLSGTGGDEYGDVTVDDAALFIGRMRSGALASFEATRFAAGAKNDMGIELYGSKGGLKFSFEAMNELWVHDATADPATGGFTRVLATEGADPYSGSWYPPGHVLGYDHTFVHEIADFVRAIGDETDPTPSFADALSVQRVLAAVEDSAAADGCWQEVAE
ncbi:Gfo/Idh/MocA family oxidoreductase [Nitriliruptoria bacterium AS10]|nr:Gfo/Idh/MocA family oxidoreductase [Salsipaludibacter albus]